MVQNGEILATEVVRTLVCSIGLAASVPITTLLAARAAAAGPARRKVEPPGPDGVVSPPTRPGGGGDADPASHPRATVAAVAQVADLWPEMREGAISSVRGWAQSVGLMTIR